MGEPPEEMGLGTEVGVLGTKGRRESQGGRGCGPAPFPELEAEASDAKPPGDREGPGAAMGEAWAQWEQLQWPRPPPGDSPPGQTGTQTGWDRPPVPPETEQDLQFRKSTAVLSPRSTNPTLSWVRYAKGFALACCEHSSVNPLRVSKS